MSGKKVYYIFFAILVVGLIITSYARTIFPIMGYDEFFVDENEIIHNKSCPYKDIPWFTKKQGKYDFMKEPQQEFCRECFLDEEIDKLLMIHDYNIKNEELRLKRAGANEEYIKAKLGEYGY